MKDRGKQRLGGQEKKKLYELVKKINLVEFIERETGKTPMDGGGSWKMNCPMPAHKDADPSFHIYSQSGQWFYRCYGCDSKGTIVDFCVGYRSFQHPSEALVYVLEKYGIKTDADFLARAVKDAKVECDKKQRMESAHFVASSNCRRLLRMYNGDEIVMEWVSGAYRSMNSMLDAGDIWGIEGVSSKACEMMSAPPEEKKA